MLAAWMCDKVKRDFSISLNGQTTIDYQSWSIYHQSPEVEFALIFGFWSKIP